MAEYQGREQLETWLRERPREVSVVIAARAALRVLPFVFMESVAAIDRQRVILSVFRALALAWSASRFPNYSKYFGKVIAASVHDTERAIRYSTNTSYSTAKIAHFAVSALNAEADIDACGFTSDIVNELKTDHIFTDAPIFDDVAYLAQYSGISILVGSTITLSSMSIWPRAFPNPYHEFWARLKAGLLAIPDENWQVWTDWYDDRLKGHPANEQHELARALLPNELWQQGPKVVNARIAEILAQKEEPPPLTPPPKIPATRPGALEPEWVEGRLVLPASLRRPSRLDELAALRNQLLRLAEALDAEANIDPRIRIYLRQIAANVPEKAPTQLQVFQIGHDLAAITGYAATVTAEWPELLAQRYHAMAIAFDRTMRKFPRWVAFLRNSPKKHEEQVDAAKLGEVVASMGAALRDDIAKERISEEIPEAYELLTQPIVSRDAWRKTITEGNDLLIGDVLESTNNILKRLAEYAVAASNATSGSFIGRAAGEYAKKYQKSFIKKAGDHGEKDGAATVKWIKRILIGSIGSGTAWLIATRPEMFGWLGAVLKFLQ